MRLASEGILGERGRFLLAAPRTQDAIGSVRLYLRSRVFGQQRSLGDVSDFAEFEERQRR
jgi:hypothetical protein